MIMHPTAPARGRAGRRTLRALAVTAATLGAVALTAGPASAETNCTGSGNATVCLGIDGVGGGRFAVHVGIDVHVSRAVAQEYLDDAGDPFTVWIKGDDGEFLFRLPVTAMGATDLSGLSGDFDLIVPGTALNEDSGTDEIIAVVTLTDTDTNTVTATYTSGRIVGNWP